MPRNEDEEPVDILCVNEKYSYHPASGQSIIQMEELNVLITCYITNQVMRIAAIILI